MKTLQMSDSGMLPTRCFTLKGGSDGEFTRPGLGELLVSALLESAV